MNASHCFACVGVLLAAGPICPAAPPKVVVDCDNVEIAQSCIIEIGAAVIADADGNGVIHIKADGITVEFSADRAKREMYGAPEGTPWDEVTGIGIVIDGHRDVTIRGAHCHRYKVGILARHADGLTIADCDVAGGFAQRLRSTPAAEDGADWLFPHHNDNREWVTQFGAGVCVERSRRVTISGTFARRRQNGIILDRVSDSRLFDNDCSFLSGWGLAMWRSSGNVITRNAFDFCVRGYSHMVYNRGQDSAGILMFEQCNDNIIAENSATHGGDGFFGFAGREALGDAPPREDMTEEELIQFCAEKGNNNNLLIANDFSYAPAHGIEMTFSFHNQFLDNRLVENAICGIWGGYSRMTTIAYNTIVGNGEMAYGLERGGINIEHGAFNYIAHNTFERNKCGVHIWWDNDEHLFKTPWAKANYETWGAQGAQSNHVIFNTFDGDVLGVHLRAAKRNHVGENTFRNVQKEMDADEASLPVEAPMMAAGIDRPNYPVYGETRPVGARAHLRGRDKIIMHEWGPWDHESPLVRLSQATGRRHQYDVLGASGPMRIGAAPPGVEVEVDDPAPGRHALLVRAMRDGVSTYSIPVTIGDDYRTTISGTIIRATWNVTFFKWEREKTDPRADLDGWRSLAKGPTAVKLTTDSLSFPFAMGGPKDVPGLPEREALARLGGDHFGTIARTRLPLTAGRWRITTRSDDGVRVTINAPGHDDTRVIDNWTWHGPTVDRGEFTLAADAEVDLLIEHFEIDGYAVLEFSIERVE